MIDPKQMVDSHGLSIDSLRGTEFHIRPQMVNPDNVRQTDAGNDIVREPLSYHEAASLLLTGQDVSDTAVAESARDALKSLRPTDVDTNLNNTPVDPYAVFDSRVHSGSNLRASETITPAPNHPAPYRAPTYSDFEAWARDNGWTPPPSPATEDDKTQSHPTDVPPPFGSDV